MLCYLGAESPTVACRQRAPPPANTVGLPRLPVWNSQALHLARTDTLPPSCREPNTILRTKECKKGINTKKVNISVLIVKIIPGQEFRSNHLSPCRAPPRPGHDGRSSFSNLRSLSRPPRGGWRGGRRPGRVCSSNSLPSPTSSSAVVGRHRTNRSGSESPERRQACVRNNAQTSPVQCQLPPAFGQEEI